MKITMSQIDQLKSALSGGKLPEGDITQKIENRYHVGAVWFGDWLRKADRGRFGWKEKPRHFACIFRRNKPKTWFTLCPITSKRKKAPVAVHLPRGTIPGGRFVPSYILVRFKLRAKCQTLNEHFDFKCNLSQHYIGQMKDFANQMRLVNEH